jgi:hypothetical protein
MRFSFLMFALVASLCRPATGAPIVTLQFDELPENTPGNGRTVSGVTFTFEEAGVPSDELVYNFEIGIPLTHLTDPVLFGPASGRLLLDFAIPTGILEFGAALDVLDPLTPGLMVELFDPMLNPLGAIGLDATPLLSFSEGQFSYAGTPIGRAIIDFSPSASSFALDNLTYAIPEPTVGVLVLCGLVGILATRNRQRCQQVPKNK